MLDTEKDLRAPSPLFPVLQTASPQSNQCPFCQSEKLDLKYEAMIHPLVSFHGPFDLYQCKGCHSFATYPLPSRARLSALYQSFSGGIPAETREFQAFSPQTALYRGYAERVGILAGKSREDHFTWIDIGAGRGNLCRAMMEAFPRSEGMGVDLHARPESLDGHGKVAWRESDINEDFFADELRVRADVVIATAVWEHVCKPDAFARNLLRLTKRPGWIFLLCPNYDSPARKAMGKKWAFLTPGEHLFMPTPKGAIACMTRESKKVYPGETPATVTARPINQPYSLGYFLFYLGMKRLARFFPRFTVKLPVGVMETCVHLP